MSASLIEHLDAEIADLEHQLGALRQARSVLAGKAPGPAAGRKPRSGEQRRPPSEAKPGKRAAKREAAVARLRELLLKDPDISVDQARKKVRIGWDLAKALLEEIRG